MTTVTVRRRTTGDWAVEVGGRKKSTHRLKRRAKERARKEARKRAPATLKVQNTDGTWHTEATYR